MKLTANDLFATQQPSLHCPCSSSSSSHPHRNRFVPIKSISDSDHRSRTAFTRRAILLAPSLISVAASLFLKPSISLAAEETITSPTESVTVTPPPPPPKEEERITSRIYDATAIGEPMALGKDKKRVWEKLMNARVVYLGEAEQVPTKDDKELELEIVRNLKTRCVESERQVSVALEAFPLDLQDQLNQYMDKRMDGEMLKSYVTHWSAQRWQEYEPLLSYCRDNAVRLIACGTPLKVESQVLPIHTQ